MYSLLVTSPNLPRVQGHSYLPLLARVPQCQGQPQHQAHGPVCIVVALRVTLPWPEISSSARLSDTPLKPTFLLLVFVSHPHLVFLRNSLLCLLHTLVAVEPPILVTGWRTRSSRAPAFIYLRPIGQTSIYTIPLPEKEPSPSRSLSPFVLLSSIYSASSNPSAAGQEAAVDPRG
jgi:hypothetical protein